MSNNAIGDQGESIFCTRISQGGLFKVYFLGEKAPYVDFLLEIIGEKGHPLFLVQVKSTTLGYTKNKHLKANVPQKKMDHLLNHYLPTYVAGVDIDGEKVYLCPAFKPGTQYQSIPTNHCLDFTNKPQSLVELKLLKEDVISYWSNSTMTNYKQSYCSLL